MTITTRAKRQQRRNEALQLISKDTRAAAHQWPQSNDWEVLLMLARPHPVLGWLHCQPEDSRRLLDRQLAHRDHALEADPSFSGMPASFVDETWVNWLPKAVAKPFYRDQLTSHVAELERQITNLSREIELQSGGLLDQSDSAVDLRERLKHLVKLSTVDI